MVTKGDSTSVILRGYEANLYNWSHNNADLGNGADGWQATASDSPNFLLTMSRIRRAPFNLPRVGRIVSQRDLMGLTRAETAKVPPFGSCRSSSGYCS
jgi:hypothetical protein